MPIVASCPGCKQNLSVPEEYAGMQGTCPSCGSPVLFAAPGSLAYGDPTRTAAFVVPERPAAYASPVTAAPATPAVAVPAAAPIDVQEVLTLAGLGVTIFFLVLLIVASLLSWYSSPAERTVSRQVGGMAVTIPGMTRRGTEYGDGRVLICLSLLLIGLVATCFFARSQVPLIMTIAGAFGTFTLLMMLSRVGNAGAGIWVGLPAALGLMGAAITTAARCPLTFEAPAIPNPFVRTYGILLASQGLALFFGLFYVLLRAAF